MRKVVALFAQAMAVGLSAAWVIDLFCWGTTRGWIAKAIREDTFSLLMATIAQVGVPVAIAAATVPFLISAFSRQETTRIARATAFRNWWSALSASSATLAALGSLAVLAGKGTLADPRLADLGAGSVVLFLDSLLLAIVAVDREIAAADPYRLADLVVAGFTPSSAHNFGVVREVSANEVAIVRHNLDFEVRDPLGPFHELMTVAWTARDRVLVLTLLRRLLGTVVRPLRIPFRELGYTLLASSSEHQTRSGRRVRDMATRAERDNCVHLVHALHYVVRNAGPASVRQSTSGGSPGDGQRRLFALAVINLYDSLAICPAAERQRRYCLYALTHMMVATQALTAQGDQEPFGLVGVLLPALEQRVGPREADHLRHAARVWSFIVDGQSSAIALAKEAEYLSSTLPDPWGSLRRNHLEWKRPADVGDEQPLSLPQTVDPPGSSLAKRLKDGWRQVLARHVT